MKNIQSGQDENRLANDASRKRHVFVIAVCCLVFSLVLGAYDMACSGGFSEAPILLFFFAVFSFLYERANQRRNKTRR